MITIRYFASLREAVGCANEQLERPEIPAVATLIAELCDRGEPWVSAFGPQRRVLVAINQEMADLDSPVRSGDEVAFFPPVTGG